jgi:cell division GTPase FtsZ
MTQKQKIIDDIFTPLLSSESTKEKTNHIPMSTEQATQEINIENKSKKMTGKQNLEIKRSYQFGVIGSGQAGSRLAECFYACKYPTLCFNTARQDLEHIKIPEGNKYLLNYGFGGAAKEIEIGKSAAETHRELISEAVRVSLSESEIFLLCLSLGGGSGSGSAETMIDILSSFEKPILVITVLPSSNEDVKSKKNALETLSKLMSKLESKQISNLFVIDNAKIESTLSSLGALEMYPSANKSIAEVLDQMNIFSQQSSPIKGLDPMEFGKLMVDGGGLSIFSKTSIQNMTNEAEVAEAIVQNINSSLLVSDCDVKQSKYVGVFLSANQNTWNSVPAVAFTYAESVLRELCENPNGIFKGFYVANLPDNTIEIYSCFSGLPLPEERIRQLQEEVQEQEEKLRQKELQRNMNLKLNPGTNTSVFAAQKIKTGIDTKKSSFGGLLNQGLKNKKF